VKSVTAIYIYLKKHRYQTLVMGASFRNIDEIRLLAGCDLLTISPKLLAGLASTTGDLPRMLSLDTARAIPSERLSLDQEMFERMHRENPMARAQLSQGIEGFSTALSELEALLIERQAVIGVRR
jgi:transaldolase